MYYATDKQILERLEITETNPSDSEMLYHRLRYLFHTLIYMQQGINILEVCEHNYTEDQLKEEGERLQTILNSVKYYLTLQNRNFISDLQLKAFVAEQAETYELEDIQMHEMLALVHW